MRKFVLLALTAVTALACSAVAFAQTAAAPTIDGTLKVTPVKAGTKAKPANGNVTAIFNVNEESNSTLEGIEYTIPKGIKVDGTGFPTCSEETVAGGEANCDPKSRVGTGAATALLGPNKSRLDFTVNVYASSAKSLTLALTNSLVGTVAVPATINGQVVKFILPERVQSPAPGLFAYVTTVTANLGKQNGIPAQITTGKGKKKKNKPFVGITGCSSKNKFTGSVKALLAANPNPPQVDSISFTATAPCKAAKKPKKK